MSAIAELEASQLPPAPRQLLGDTPRPDWSALFIRSFLNRSQVNEIVATFYAHRNAWLPHYGGEQFSLGEVWYAHVDAETTSEYFRRSADSVRTITKIFPDLYNQLLALCQRLVCDQRVVLRPGWAGPGIVIFPSGERTSNLGGDVHFDWDGLTDEELSSPATFAYSFICMLQKPEEGGDLRVWPVFFDNENIADGKAVGKPQPAQPPVLIRYELGAMVVIPSLRLHQIAPFAGSNDRICLTFHMAKRGSSWEVWF